MKVWKRILIKTVILTAVIAAGGGAAASYQAYRQSSAQYAIDHYLTLLIDNSQAKAYACLDQSETEMMTVDTYEKAIDAQKYSLYSFYDVTQEEKRRDSDGNEYVDYHAKFKDATGEVKLEEDFTVKKQAKQVYGIFDHWKVLSDHCLVKDFVLTVPVGSEVYIEGKQADTNWISRENVKSSCDRYCIPTLISGNTELVIRHPILQSINGMLDTDAGSSDYTDKMTLKDSAQSACKELGIKFLKIVYTSAVKGQTEDSEKILEDVSKEAQQLIEKQKAKFHPEDGMLQSVGVSKFATQFSELIFTDEADGAIMTDMTLSWHYVIEKDMAADTEKPGEDENSSGEPEAIKTAGDTTAKLTLAYYDGNWHITDIKMDTIPEEK